MTVAIFSDDRVTGELLAALLARVEIEAITLRRPRVGVDLDLYLTTLGARFTDILAVGQPAIGGTRAIELHPSLEAWLTRDPDANQHVLGTGEVPRPEDARTWLVERSPSPGRLYSPTLDGRALVERLDLGLLAAASIEFRTLIGALRPGWATKQPIKRGRGRPPGVQLFQGTGYALCLELLHRGERAEVSTGELAQALARSKTAALRMIAEAERRGFLRRTSVRGPVQIRNTDRLVDDLVTSAKADAARRPPVLVGLRTDRDPAGLPARVAKALGELGRICALTGAAAVTDLGGDLLVGAPVRAYANTLSLPRLLADAYPDPRAPTLILVEPVEEAVFHRQRPGTPALVSPWQAAIDLLASDSEREREVGTEVRRRLEQR